jgi:hypothetical protein
LPWDDLLRQGKPNRLSIKIHQHATMRDNTHNFTLETLANSKRPRSINRQHLGGQYHTPRSTNTGTVQRTTSTSQQSRQ